jgi:hypothetical protein
MAARVHSAPPPAPDRHPVRSTRKDGYEAAPERPAFIPRASRIKFTTDDRSRAKGQKIAIFNADAVEYFGA